MDQLTPQFILSRHWQDTATGIELRFWLLNAQTRYCWTVEHQSSSCFVAQSQLQTWQSIWRRMSMDVRIGDKTFNSLMGDVVVPVYSQGFAEQRRWVWQGKDVGLKVWEDDINPADRFLMERFLFGSLQFEQARVQPAHCEPELKVLSIDIETAWYEPGKTPELYSVALAGVGLQRVYVIAKAPANVKNYGFDCIFFDDVKTLLQAVVQDIQDYDPDTLIGWNVIDFDLRILQNHCDQQEVLFAIGRDQHTPKWRKAVEQKERYFIEVEGRQIVDGPGAFRSAAWAFDDYSLETVSRTLLQRGKKIDHSDDRVGEIERMYRQDLASFARYNLEDAQLVIDLFDTAGLWHFLTERAHLTGLPMDRSGGSSAAFNTVYMPRLHRKGYVASSVGEQTLQLNSPGGFVMESQPGIYQNVLVLDFKSLYPSIIRTFLIDPLGLQEGLKGDVQKAVPGFLDASFHREEHILPALIDQLWAARDQAKAEKNAPMSQAIKIIMNSFYGVLGSQLCRFFDPRLASSITLRGHEILQKSAQFIEQAGYRVIYGDTDSVFVHAAEHPNPQALGEQLTAELNHWWQQELQQKYQIESRLEMEFETHYSRFVMPTIRGTEKGSKKRYAGWVEQVGQEPKMVFKGLEAVRSDWTQLAKQFQTELYRRVFADEDYRSFICQTVLALKAGQLDDQLVYRRRLRREIELYEKQTPPQVQAARLKRQINPRWQGRNIEYVKTVQGWQPVPYVNAAIDYQHYLDKQLMPIADALLHFLDESFSALIEEQMSLF